MLKAKTPSGAAPCTCEDHSHRAQAGLEGCSYVGDKACECAFSNGSMMFAADDPLRDTPAKAARYAANIERLLARQDEDAAAALRLLGSVPVTETPVVVGIDPAAGASVTIGPNGLKVTGGVLTLNGTPLA